MDPSRTVEEFHKLYYGSPDTWRKSFWLGHEIGKCATDLLIYQEIIWETRPQLIVECGTYKGGSALFMATILDAIGQGKVLTVDINPKPGRPVHPRIEYFHGSSISGEALAHVRSRISDPCPTMVVLDSDHVKDHVLREMQLYGPLVSRGCYMIVEDSNINGHPVLPEYGPGPMEAIDEFLPGQSDFVVDESRERLFVTFNPRGYLKRV